MRAVLLAVLAACGSSSPATTDGTTAGDAAGSASDLDGWLYTDGAQLKVHDAAGGTRWMGRGVNMDDLHLCGFNSGLATNDAGTKLNEIANGLITTWKPTFVRVSLGMASFSPNVSWTTNPAQYATPMTSVIEGLGAHPGVYVLVALRSDTSMTGQDTQDGDAEATGVPSANTDAVYAALVDTFAHDKFVLFGLSNEPGGNKRTDAELASAMSHAVTAIRGEEDKLGVPHHVISVQGNSWTSNISAYATTPIASDNIVYEIHNYPPPPETYTYSNIPVIIGEYGSLADSAAFYADLEAKQIPNLAWDFEPFSDCGPDLLQVTGDSQQLTPTAWGMTVMGYLTSH